MDNFGALVAPKGLRKAISIIMIIVGAAFGIIGLYYTISAGTIDTSNSTAVIAIIMLLVIGIFTLAEGAFYLIFGILGCTKINDGRKHKKLLSIAILVISCIFLTFSIIYTIEYSATSAITIYIFLAILSIASIIFISLSLYEASKKGHNEKLYGIIGSALLLAYNATNDIFNIFDSISSAVTASSIAGSVIGLLIDLTLYVLYLVYFIKLEPSVISLTGTSSTSIDKIKAIEGYKSLLDKGAISQEEYDQKKNELLK